LYEIVIDALREVKVHALEIIVEKRLTAVGTRSRGDTHVMYLGPTIQIRGIGIPRG
jgi:hypothetical protein